MISSNIPPTEFNFTLPKGLIDEEGNIHRQGIMRLATAKDEIVVQKNTRAQTEPIYSVLVRLSRVITILGTLSSVTPEILENLFTVDLAYLREFYNRINQQNHAYFGVQCPQCNHNFRVDLALSGES
ncbi:MAG: phage tail assembly protein [Okeania sp. SIO2D1]|nr:phage tail assembly protein [Okeania sp. SIO2D1]